MDCVDIDSTVPTPERDCRRCYFSQRPALDDRFYIEAVRPYCWFAAVLLFLSYIIGLWFTLRTHAAVIWNNESDEKKVQETALTSSQATELPAAARLHRQPTMMTDRHSEVRETQLYKRILGNSLREAGLATPEEICRYDSMSDSQAPNGSTATVHQVPPKSSAGESSRSVQIDGFTEMQSSSLVREVAEMAATAATFAARDATRAIRKKSLAEQGHSYSAHKPSSSRPAAVHAITEDPTGGEALAAGAGGHDAPNWSRLKSAVILCGATVLYALIAEILVNTVDEVLANISIDEKFLGITLFALVPNTTEFLVSVRS